MRKKGAYFRLSLLLYFLPLFFTMKHVDLCRGLVSTLFNMQWKSHVPPTLMLQNSAEGVVFILLCLHLAMVCKTWILRVFGLPTSSFCLKWKSEHNISGRGSVSILGQKIKENTCYARWVSFSIRDDKRSPKNAWFQESAVNFSCFSEQSATSAEASSEISFITEAQYVFLETKTTRLCYNQRLLAKF